MDYKYKYHLKGCSMPRPTLYQSLKSCSTEQFIDRFKKLPSYNAIHSLIKKNVDQAIKQINQNDISNKISLLKLFTSCQKKHIKQQVAFKKNKAVSLNKKIDEKLLHKNKKYKNIKDKYPKLKISLKDKDLYPQYHTQSKKIDEERIMLKTKSSKNIMNSLPLQKQFQKKTHAPYDDCQLLGIYDNSFSNNINERLSPHKLQDKSQENLGNKPLIYQKITQLQRKRQLISIKDYQSKDKDDLFRLSPYSSKKNTPKQNSIHLLQDSILGSRLSKTKLYRNQIVAANQKYKKFRTQCKLYKQGKQNQVFLGIKQKYIQNLMKTTCFQSKKRTSVKSKYQNLCADDHSVLFRHLSSNMIDVLHPEGQFPNQFQSQFNPW